LGGFEQIIEGSIHAGLQLFKLCNLLGHVCCCFRALDRAWLSWNGRFYSIDDAKVTFADRWKLK
jgi:hypothetical protein